VSPLEAARWVAESSGTDLDDGDLAAAFAALYGREPDREDREVGLWSLLCAGEPWEAQP
jgi:hypothetical protein